jgi:curved DNA-binding protein CbpA
MSAAADPAAATEIRALVHILDELDYYELLGVPRGSSAAAVKQGYHSASRRFHPDAHRHLDVELRGSVERIARRVTEAYTVLRDPKRRRVYDERLGGGQSGKRLQLAEAKVEAGKRATEDVGKTPQGRRYFALALQELARGDAAAAARHLQTALTFEPTNAGFRAKLEDLRTARR